MTDSVDPGPSGPATVRDHRTALRPALAHWRPQYWKPLAVCGAGALFFIWAAIAPAPKPREPQPARVTTPRPSNAGTLAAYQEQLRDNERLEAQQIPALIPPETRPMQGRSGGTSAPDTLAAERAKREYDSLFSSNVVGGGSRLSGQDRAPAAARRRDEPGPVDDDALLGKTVDAVLRRSGVMAPSMSLGQSPAPAPTAAPETTKGPVRTPAIDPSGLVHPLLEGSLIDTVLTNRLDGSSASPVNVMVTHPVYSYHGNVVLIPAGARVLGETKPVQAFGETRLAVSFHRVILPDGSTVSLDQYKALNQAGDTGLHDQVNSHYLSTFGYSAAIGLVTGLGQMVGNRGLGGNGNNRAVVVAGDIGNSTSQASNQVLQRFLNRLPTITIREGTRVSVYVTHDMELPAYPLTERTHGNE